MNVKVTITCSKCHHTFDYEGCLENKGVDKRGMGEEILYEDSDVNTQCPKCGCSIKGSISYWEYPEGSLNAFDSDLTNAKATVTQI